jgi:two-component system NarL family sensor kinase
MASFPFNKRYIVVLVAFLLPTSIFGQLRVIDSLKQRIYSAVNDTKKINAIFSLCDHANSLSPDTLSIYLAQAKAIAVKNNDRLSLLNTDYYQTIYFLKKSRMDSAELLINEIIPRLNDTSQRSLKYKFLALKCNMLIKSNRQKEAIGEGLQLLRDAEVNDDTLTQLRIKLTIGWAYMELGQDEEALKWFFETIKLNQVVIEKYKQPILYSDIAAAYNDLNKNDSAEFFVKQAIDMAFERNDLTTLANAYNIYADICIEENKNPKAEELLETAVKIRRQIGDPFFIVSDIYQLGIFYAHTHQAAKGIAIVQEGISLAEKEKILEKLPILYEALAENYKAASDMKMYSQSLLKIIQLKDSLYKKNSAEALSEMQTKYEVQKKENIIIGQQLDLVRKNNLFYGLLVLLVLILILGYVFFQNRKKNQQLKMQQLIFEQKKSTAAAVLQAGENERKRIAEDLHDSVAQKMVAAKLNLEALESDLPELNQVQQKVLNNISSLVDQSCTEVRSLSHSMMPQAFSKSGLTDAISDLIDKIDNNVLKVNFNVEGNPGNIDKDKEIMIYRILQECIQNVMKHAKAATLDISMIVGNNEVDFTIEDNGVGFDIKYMKENLGMKNIRSRIDFLNGKLDIDSKPGMGTIIAFYIPLV